MKTSFEKKTANLFSILGNPFRIKLLLTIGDGEACVCHLEALLDQRQAILLQSFYGIEKSRAFEKQERREVCFLSIE